MNWQRYKKELEEKIEEIAEIIYMELDIEYQDVWLKRCIEAGLWKPPE